MSTLDQLKGQLGRAWESVAEGWQHLRARGRGGDALHPGAVGGLRGDGQ